MTFVLTYQKEDSNLVYQWNTDTLKLRYFEQKQKAKRKNETVDTSLKYSLNVKSKGTLDLNSKLNFLLKLRLHPSILLKLKLFAIIDTVEFPVEYTFLMIV